MYRCANWEKSKERLQLSQGYAWSTDQGRTWESDLSRPALFPKLSQDEAEINGTASGSKLIDYAIGCIEDPRLFRFEGQVYMTTACRMFAPGPYWEHDEPTQCAPTWIRGKHTLGRAATENITVSVLYRVNLDALVAEKYEDAFQYMGNLTAPEMGENRDVVLFPERLEIDGKKQIVCLHRPWNPRTYPGLKDVELPSIVGCYAERFEDLGRSTAPQFLLASPRFDWEGDRIGASGQLVKISNHRWLVSYHGKKDSTVGYTQSFMIVDSAEGGVPRVIHRCPERILFAQEDWEMPGTFKTPVVFITGVELIGSELLVAYGAADEKIGVARIDFEQLLETISKYDANGKTV